MSSICGNSNKDPILTAFELSWELKQLAFDEYEFKSEYLVSEQGTLTFNRTMVLLKSVIFVRDGIVVSFE